MHEIETVSPVSVSSTNSEEETEIPAVDKNADDDESAEKELSANVPVTDEGNERSSTRKLWRKDFEASGILSSENDEQIREQIEGIVDCPRVTLQFSATFNKAHFPF